MTNASSTTQPRTVVEEVTPTFTIIHTEACLTSNSGYQISRNEPPENEDWSPLAMEILEIPGVEVVVLRPYGIGIHRAVAFDWDPILAEAQRLLYWVGHAFNPYGTDSSLAATERADTLTKVASEGDRE